MIVFRNLMKSTTTFILRVQHERLRKVLLGYSARQLADMGFDREKLLAGSGDWPWRLPASAAPPRRAGADRPLGQAPVSLTPAANDAPAAGRLAA